MRQPLSQASSGQAAAARNRWADAGRAAFPDENETAAVAAVAASSTRCGVGCKRRRRMKRSAAAERTFLIARAASSSDWNDGSRPLQTYDGGGDDPSDEQMRCEFDGNLYRRRPLGVEEG